MKKLGVFILFFRVLPLLEFHPANNHVLRTFHFHGTLLTTPPFQINYIIRKKYRKADDDRRLNQGIRLEAAERTVCTVSAILKAYGG